MAKKTDGILPTTVERGPSVCLSNAKVTLFLKFAKNNAINKCYNVTQKGHTPKKRRVPFITSYRFSYFWLSEKSITFLRFACMRS